MKNYLLYLCSLNCLFSCYAPSVIKEGVAEKVYLDTCDRQPVSLDYFEHCLLSSTNPSSKFGMQIKDIH